MSELARSCGDCGAKPGHHHKPGCDCERCPRCGLQAISCCCVYEVNGMDRFGLEDDHPEIYANGPTPEMYDRWDAEWGHRRMPWTGEWPGVAECREYGVDLNELPRVCRWDAEKQRWMKR